jgi:hypothetical protein
MMYLAAYLAVFLFVATHPRLACVLGVMLGRAG